jgi:hypothetical protein
MNSVEVHGHVGTAFQHSASKKHRFAWFLLGSLVTGILSAITYCVVSHGQSGLQDWGSNASPHAGLACNSDHLSVAHELEAGLNTVVEWFPAEAAHVIRANKEEIVMRIANFTDPPKSSVLRKLVFARQDSNMLLAFSRNSTLLSSRRLQGGTKTVTQPSATNGCKWAVSDFVCDLIHFVTGFEEFYIPEKSTFCVALLHWLETTQSERDFEKLRSQVIDFNHARGAKEKAKVTWEILKRTWRSGGGFMKFFFRWVIEKHTKQDGSRDSWAIIKSCVQMAAQLSMWFLDGLFAFLGSMTFQIMSARSLIENGAKAMHVC